MLEGLPGDVLPSFKCKFESKREEVPLAEVGDLMSEKPGVLGESGLSIHSKAIRVKESHIGLSEKLCQLMQFDGILPHVEEAMPKGTKGAEAMQGGIRMFMCGG